MSARLLHYVHPHGLLPPGKTRAKRLETACGHFRRSVAVTNVAADVTCIKCLPPRGLEALSYSDTMAVCGPGSKGDR